VLPTCSAIADTHRSPSPPSHAVDERAVLAAEILEQVLVADARDPRMLREHVAAVQRDVDVPRPITTGVRTMRNARPMSAPATHTSRTGAAYRPVTSSETNIGAIPLTSVVLSSSSPRIDLSR
jgi:hypothetical protein